jgi:hypothetical protein
LNLPRSEALCGAPSGAVCDVDGRKQGNMVRLIRLVRLVALCLVSLYSQVAVCDERSAPPAQGPGTPRSFKECVQAGGRIQETQPPRCVLDSGLVFVEPPVGQKSTCKDLCGDGACQEMVCMAVGCPCAESTTSCPADCR